MEREFDVVVFGATGFVGRLVAQYLAARVPDPSRLAVAGRDAARLAEVAESLGDLPTVVADVDDPGSLTAMASRARVLVSTVGPYTKYGLGVVGACVAAGTHYCDLNGEVLFHRDVADLFDEPARAAGVSILQACGFDSIPGDLGCYVAAARAREKGLGELTTTTFHLLELSGGMSGGTIDALRTQIDATRSGVRTPGRSSSDPYALSPSRADEPEPRGPRPPLVLRPRLSPETGQWCAPFFMGRYNEQVVRRSNALQGWAYGRGFRYTELHDLGRGWLGRVRAQLVTLALPALVIGMTTPGLRQLLDAVLPAPGEGPSEASRAKGHFLVEIHARTTSGEKVVVTVADRRDPGYGGTAVMIGECALALAAGEAAAPGVSTPAAALGPTLPDRLRAQGFHIV